MTDDIVEDLLRVAQAKAAASKKLAKAKFPPPVGEVTSIRAVYEAVKIEDVLEGKAALTIKALRTQRDEAVAALRKYGAHKQYRCHKASRRDDYQASECTCGLEDALAKLDKADAD